MAEIGSDVWLLCSACRKDIPFGGVHWVCSVSTCNRSRTRLVFCSVACWDSHLATLRHREAWAVEEIAPNREQHARQQADEARASAPASARPWTPSPPSAVRPPPPRAVPVAFDAGVGAVTAHAGGPALSSSYEHDDVLIVVSKVKKYIRDRSGMNTSDGVAEGLGEHVRQACDEAIRAAARDGRKTVLDRDVPKIRR